MTQWLAGLESVFSPFALAMMVVGVLVGMVVGALPGFSSTMAVAVLAPFTFALDPLPGLMMLLAITASAMYSGAIPAILLSTPGTPGAAATVIDGYPMRERGRAGAALAISLVASVVGGLIGVVLVALLAPALADVALSFGPAELFMLAVFALTVIAVSSSGPLLPGLVGVALGVGVSTVGLDPIQAYARYAFDSTAMTSGVQYIPVLIGMFGVAEAMRQLEQASVDSGAVRYPTTSFRVPLAEWRWMTPTGLLSSVIGFLVGVLPGTGGTVGSFVAYNETRRFARDKSQFGKGDPRGVCASEAANNASVAGALAPMLTLGIPGDGVTAILIGALTVHGLTPGPQLFERHPDLVYGMFAGLVVVQVLVLVVGWAGIRAWVHVIRVPQGILWPVVIVLCIVGTFAVRSNPFDVVVMLVAGLVGYLLVKGGYPRIPIIMGLIMGPILESGLRRALVAHQGSLSWLLEPVTLTLLLLTVASLVARVVAARRARSGDKAQRASAARL